MTLSPKEITAPDGRLLRITAATEKTVVIEGKTYNLRPLRVKHVKWFAAKWPGQAEKIRVDPNLMTDEQFMFIFWCAAYQPTTLDYAAFEQATDSLPVIRTGLFEEVVSFFIGVDVQQLSGPSSSTSSSG